MVCCSIPHEDSDFFICPKLVRRRKLNIFLIWNAIYNICSFRKQDGIVSYCCSFKEFEWGLDYDIKTEKKKNNQSLHQNPNSTRNSKKIDQYTLSESTKVISLNRSIEFNDLAYSAVSKKTVGKTHKSKCTNPEMYRG